MGVNLGRFLAERCSTPIWWRSARFSNSRAARERKTEDKVAKRVAKEMSIGGENYDSSIIPVRSDISRFSRSTLGLGNELLADFRRGLSKEVMTKGCRLGDVLNQADMAPAFNRLLAEENKTPLHWVCIGYALSQEGKTPNS